MNKRWVFAVLVVFSLGLAACQPSAAAPVDPVVNAEVSQGVIVQGRVEPLNAIDLAFSASGRVVEVLSGEGEVVEEGQVIARLSGSEARLAELARAWQEKAAAEQALKEIEKAAELNPAQAQFKAIEARNEVINATEKLDDLKAQYQPDLHEVDEAAARLELAQVEAKMAKDQAAALVNGIDPDVYAAAKIRLDTAGSAVTAAQAAVDALELRAPLAGTLVGLDLQPGQFVNAGQVVGTTVDFSSWLVKTDDLTELEVVRVNKGEQARLVLDALPDSTMNAEVIHIAQRYEEKRGDVTYTVTLAISDPVEALRWGMSGQITFMESE